ncbi:MAG: T9SS type A sorting domain-containing protein [Porphyromonadaceae bacterium]|nr:T9SS type A sorting domain-containing protein [Porphyromonadaceae bacterium]
MAYSARYSISKGIRRTLLALCLVFGAAEMAWCIRTDSLWQQQVARDVLSLRCRPPKVTYSRPLGGVVSASNGTTIVIAGNQVQGAVQVEAPTSLMPRGNEMGGQGGKIELRIMGRTIYFNQEVEQVELIDLTGRRLMVQYNTRQTSLGDIRSGVYLLRCSRAGQLVTTRLVLR